MKTAKTWDSQFTITGLVNIPQTYVGPNENYIVQWHIRPNNIIVTLANGK